MEKNITQQREKIHLAVKRRLKVDQRSSNAGKHVLRATFNCQSTPATQIIIRHQITRIKWNLFFVGFEMEIKLFEFNQQQKNRCAMILIGKES